MEKTTFRPARPEDSRQIAELFRISSDGVADYIWQGIGEPGEALLDIGERRFVREGTAFSYQNSTMSEKNGDVTGMVHAFVIDDGPEEDSDEDVDPVLRPYHELEVPGSLYISSMAVLPEFRQQGIGTELLQIARTRAREKGCGVLSLLVFEQNDGAVKLYQRNGYRVIDRRPVVPHPMITRTGDVLLMTAPV